MSCIYKIGGYTFKSENEVRDFINNLNPNGFLSFLSVKGFKKYEQIAEILKQERGEENVEVITDENGFDWYETKITQDDRNKPVIAFLVNETTTTLQTPLTLLKGLRGKLNADGTKRTSHPKVEGIFMSADEKVAARYGDEVLDYTFPIGTTIEKVDLLDKNYSMSELREKETLAINNSRAQIVQLNTIDAKGKETQFIVKDKTLLPEYLQKDKYEIFNALVEKGEITMNCRL